MGAVCVQEISAVLNACNNWRFDPGLEVVTAAARQVTDRPVVPGNEQVPTASYPLLHLTTSSKEPFA